MRKGVLIALLAIFAIIIIGVIISNNKITGNVIGNSASNSEIILIKFSSNPEITQGSFLNTVNGKPKVSTKFESVNKINKKYNLDNSKKLFKDIKNLENTYEFTANNAEQAILELKNNENVEYARISETGFEKKIAKEIDDLNAELKKEKADWTADYNLQVIMTDEDKFKLLGAEEDGILLGQAAPAKSGGGSKPTSDCFDDDSGKNYYHKGITSNSGQNFTDYCTGSTVREYYCSHARLYYLDFYCQYGCLDGACIRGCVPSCVDKTCGGNDGCNGTCLTGNCAAGFSCTNGICTSINIPRSYDWRNISGKNYMTPVRNQGGCGSCWAFAAVGAAEANINAYYNKNLNIDLSEQDLVSCSKAGTCAGGALSTVLNYISSNGVCQETCFKYTATNSNCSLKCSTSQDNLWKISPAVSITNNVPEITKALYGKGPLATYIGIYSDFYSYSSGIYNKSPTATYQGGHYVDIVGYGTYNGQPYYICRNSWGTGWGQGGYFKIYAGVASIGSQTKYIPNPIPPASSPQTVLCEDLDNDGYCNWGIGSKPNSCPVCSSVKDCDDINANIQSDCTQMG